MTDDATAKRIESKSMNRVKMATLLFMLEVFMDISQSSKDYGPPVPGQIISLWEPIDINTSHAHGTPLTNR
jgi:hypothetical protein